MAASTSSSTSWGRRRHYYLAVFLALWWCLVLALHPSGSDARVLDSHINRRQTPLAFLGKFCFYTPSLSEKGSMTFKPTDVRNDTDLFLAVLDDSVWDKVWDKGLSCEKVREIIESNAPAALLEPITSDKPLRIFIEDPMHPRYWYFAATKCMPGPVAFDYELEMLNPGGWWYRQFSYEDQGMTAMYLTFWLAYFVICAGLVGVFTFKWCTGSVHQLTQLFQLWCLIMAVEMCSKLLLFVHSAVYADDGVGAPALDGLADVLEMSARILFVGLLILLAKGYSLTTKAIHHKLVLIFFFCVWALSYVAFYIWQNIEDDDITTRTSFESPSGITNIVLRGLIWIYFVFCIFQTVQRSHLLESGDDAIHEYSHAVKIRFYTPFFFIGTIWFLMVPFMVIVSQGYPSYYRFKSIMAVIYTINLLIELIFGVWLYLPREGLQLLNGRGIFFGIFPSQGAEVEAEALFRSSSAAPSSKPSFGSVDDSNRQELAFQSNTKASKKQKAMELHDSL